MDKGTLGRKLRSVFSVLGVVAIAAAVQNAPGLAFPHWNKPKRYSLTETFLVLSAKAEKSLPVTCQLLVPLEQKGR